MDEAARSRTGDLTFGVRGPPGASLRHLPAALEPYLGRADRVWHEPTSHLVHVDLHLFPPRPGRPFFTVLTTGMSDRPMATPADLRDASRAELLLCLPSTWPVALKRRRHTWPLQLLRDLARYPHQAHTWLGCGHTVTNDCPPQRYAPGVPFTTALLEHPRTLPPEAARHLLPGGLRVELLGVVPLHPREVALKLEGGMDALASALAAHQVTELLDVRRPDVAPR